MQASLCQDVAIDFLAGRFEPVDLIVSYSSLEHSGLGRYGDALNPDGDKDAVAQVRRRQFFNFFCSLLTISFPHTFFLAGLVHVAARRHPCARFANGLQ